MSDWITYNYDNIIQWSRNICKNDQLYDELAHYAIEKFITHKRYKEICDREAQEPNEGHSRAFLISIMRNSWFGKKSEFRRVHALHRCDLTHKKKIVEDQVIEDIINESNFEYDYEKDFVLEAIEGIIEEMEIDVDKLWYIARLFKMYINNSNYSALARETEIPRTSISNAVEEAKVYIREELKKRNIDYDF